MKTWKKVASMLLTFSLVGGFAACGDKNQGDAPDYNTTAKNYVNTLTQTIENAKSVKINAVLQVDATENYYGQDGTSFDPALKELESEKAEVELLLTEEAGNPALSLSVRTYDLEDNGEYVAAGVVEFIIRNNLLYSRNYDADDEALWNVDTFDASLEGLTGIPNELWEELLGSSEITHLKSSISETFADKMAKKLKEQGGLKNSAVEWSVDYAPRAQDVITYWNSVDEETVQLGEFFNALTAKSKTP